MILAFKHEDMSDKHVGKIYDNWLNFVYSEFTVSITENRQIKIDEHISPMSYVIGEGGRDTYTPEEAIKDYISKPSFAAHLKSRFWSAYSIKEKLI